MLKRLFCRPKARRLELQVNSGAGASGEQIRVNLRAAVNSADIRTEMFNGRRHLVIPSYTLPDDVVMNGGLYPRAEIEASYASLENTPAPLGHPQIDGEYVSAHHPAAVNAYHAGAFNRNVKRDGHRVYLEKWVDLEFAENSARGKELLAAIEAKTPIHTSTGVLLRRETVTNANETGYSWIARDMRFDHDAILINEIGAATPDQGVGLFVNVEEAVPALTPRSYGAIRDMLQAAVSERFGKPDSWTCVDDFDGTSVVYSIDDGYFRVGYSLQGDQVTLSDAPESVERKTTFSVKAVVNKILSAMRGTVVSEPVIPPKPEAFDMTPEEKQALIDALVAKNGEAVTQAVNVAIAPIQAQVAELSKANQALSAQIQANADQALAGKRAQVAEHFGEVVANSLQGEALDAMIAKIPQHAAPLLTGYAPNSKGPATDDTLPE